MKLLPRVALGVVSLAVFAVQGVVWVVGKAVKGK